MESHDTRGPTPSRPSVKESSPLQRFARNQPGPPALLATGAVVHVERFARGIPDQRYLVGKLLVQAGGIPTRLVEWLGIDRPVDQVNRERRHENLGDNRNSHVCNPTHNTLS